MVAMGVAADGRAPAVPRNTAGLPFPARSFARRAPRSTVMLDGAHRGAYQTGMGGIRTGLLLVVALSVSCCATRHGGVPGDVHPLPWGEQPNDRAVLQARSHVERGEPKQALALLEAVLKDEPRHVDALRLRQDILRDRGRKGLLLSEAQQALRADPDDPLAWYLHGRVVADQDQKLQSFEKAVTMAPESPWPWLGLAHTLRQSDLPRALAIYERLYEVCAEHPTVAVAYAGALRQAERHALAVPVYRRLQQNTQVHGAGDLGLAQTWLSLDNREQAWLAMLEALRRRPFDPALQAIVHGWFAAGASEDQWSQVLDVLREDPERMREFGRNDGAAVLAALLQRLHQPQAAIACLRQAQVTARKPALRRLERRLLLETGDVAGFLALLRADLPMARIAEESNQLRGRWLLLLQGPWCAGDPLASAEQATALVQALLDVGLLTEVEQLAETAAARWPEAAPLRTLRDEARAELAFEAGLRRLLYQGYRDGKPTGLSEVLERIRQLATRVLGRDVVGDPARFSVPFVGEMLDPFAPGLAEHLARYNRHLVLGRRSSGVVEGMLLTRLALAELPTEPALELPGRCYEVVAFDRDVRSVSGVVGGDLAGVALLNHYLIDYDSVREWAASIADRRRIAAEDGGALVDDPLPQDPGRDPFDVAWRLALLSPVQDTDLDEAVFVTIKNHERQHLVDSFHYLPFEHNLGAGMSLLLQFGVSPAAIEAEMERRAELASLAVSPQTELVLAHIADFLTEPDVASPHHRGFGELARQLDAELRQLGVEQADAVPCRWHRLDRALVQKAANRLLDRLR
jgi:Tfp pilus assembly protein PilF